MPWPRAILGCESSVCAVRWDGPRFGGGEDRVRALLSVANRDGIGSLARELLAADVEVYATDGTRDHLAADGIEVRPVSELTGLPTLIGGQVKTFYPAIY